MRAFVIGGLLALAGGRAVLAQASPEQIEFFEKKVRPVLVNRCHHCHSAETKPAGGLRVDDRNGLLRGGNSGPAVIPGNPGGSLLLQRILHEDPKRRMPKEGSLLADAEVAILTTWIADGVAWPTEKAPSSLGRPRPSYEKLKASHWAWKPVAVPQVPAVKNASWPSGGTSGDIDRFILARLEQKNLKPVAAADRVTLIRRLTFDLTGLPPAPAEIDAFVNDRRPDAYARLVDRLLQSPRFGERWGRHWLDVARYAESSGPSRNMPYPHAWKYRDYVLDAVNRDVPFNRFIQEQIAGDLLPAAEPAERDRLLIATGFLALGPKDVNQRFPERFLMDNTDEKIDTVTRSVLGLTVSCARCHDHKFDPVPTTDYYALAGIFTSTDDAIGLRSKMGGAGYDYYNPQMLLRLSPDIPLPRDEAQIKKLEAETAAAKKQWDEIRGTQAGLAPGPDGKPKQRSFRLKYEAVQEQLLLLTDPAAHGLAAHGVRDSKVIADTEVRLRGEAERLGPVVPRGFLTAFEVPDAPRINPAQSGRLELARWLTSPANPLTARVAVNRVWHHLFGRGIVSTVDNFGAKGDVPSHPELLDYLANRFVRDGWSVKSLIRTIVLSRAYRLGSDAPKQYQEVDPANQFVWRHTPRRLDAEEMRDAILASAGRLQLTPADGSPARDLKMIEMNDNGPESRKIAKRAGQSVSRSIYLPLLRGVTPQSLEAFDPVSQTLVTGQRDATTVPTQALFLLNSSFVRRQSLALGEQLATQKDRSAAGRIRRAYQLTLGRLPTVREVERAQAFLSGYQAEYKPEYQSVPAKDKDEDDIIRPETPNAAAWMNLVQALYASAEFRFVR